MAAIRVKALLGHWRDTLDQWGTQEPHPQVGKPMGTGNSTDRAASPRDREQAGGWGFFKKHTGNLLYQ